MIHPTSLRFWANFTVAALLPFSLLAQESEKTTPKPEASDKAGSVKLPDPVAIVDGEPIASKELKEAATAMLASMGRPLESMSAEEQLFAYRSVLDRLILDHVVAKKAKDIPVSDKEINEQIEMIRTNIGGEDKFQEELKKNNETLDSLKAAIREGMQQQKFVEKALEGKGDVDTAAAKKFYEENPDSFKVPDRVRASHILLLSGADANPEEAAEKEKAIKEIKKRIDAGEDFAKLATELSEDPGSKQQGGDLDFFTKDRMVPEFAETAFKLEVGQVSDPVKTQFGYHLIKVTDKQASRDVPFEEAKENIMAFLGDQQRRAAMGDLIRELRANAKVENFLPEPKPAAGGPASILPAE
jgi:peptidyl-prolyl cis-trans isomerase C